MTVHEAAPSRPPPRPGPGNHHNWFQQIATWVAHALGAPARPLHIELVEHRRNLSFTRLPQDHSAPTIVISRDRLEFDIVAHEICHGLIPTRHEFIGEGLAYFIGCRAAGDCSHLALPGADLRKVLARYGRTAPSIDRLLSSRRPGAFERLDPVTLEGRLGLAVAACFAGYCVRTYPGFAARAAASTASCTRLAIEEAAGMQFETIRSDWHAWIA